MYGLLIFQRHLLKIQVGRAELLLPAYTTLIPF